MPEVVRELVIEDWVGIRREFVVIGDTAGGVVDAARDDTAVIDEDKAGNDEDLVVADSIEDSIEDTGTLGRKPILVEATKGCGGVEREFNCVENAGRGLLAIFAVNISKDIGRDLELATAVTMEKAGIDLELTAGNATEDTTGVGKRLVN